MSPIQQARYSLLLRAATRRWENALVQFRLGALDAGAWKPWENTIRSGFSSPGSRNWWDQAWVLYSDEFASFVDSLPPPVGATDAYRSAIFAAGTAVE